MRYEADDEHGFKANVTYNDPSGKSFVFQNRFLYIIYKRWKTTGYVKGKIGPQLKLPQKSLIRNYFFNGTKRYTFAKNQWKPEHTKTNTVFPV